MFLGFDLIAFLAPFCLGLSVRRLWTTGERLLRVFSALAVTACVAYLYVAFSVPFEAIWIELLFAAVGIFAVVCATVATPAAAVDSQNLSKLSLPVFFIIASVSFTMEARIDLALHLRLSLNGLVATKFFSSNHHQRSITIVGDDGLTTSVEGVDVDAWNAMVEDRSRLSKPAWSAFGEVDGKHVRVIPQRYVFFAGLLPD
jgi:hypothetical protein